MGAEGKARQFVDTHCVVCNDKVPKGRLYTCSLKCQKARIKAFERQIKRNRERFSSGIKVKGIRNALKSLFGGS